MSNKTVIQQASTFEMNEAKARLHEFDRELESAAHLLQEFRRENPLGFNHFLQFTSFVFLAALFFWLLVYKLVESSNRTDKLMLWAAVAVVAVSLTLASARNLFVTLRGWRLVKTLQGTTRRVEHLRTQMQAKLDDTRQ